MNARDFRRRTSRGSIETMPDPDSNRTTRMPSVVFGNKRSLGLTTSNFDTVVRKSRYLSPSPSSMRQTKHIFGSTAGLKDLSTTINSNLEINYNKIKNIAKPEKAKRVFLTTNLTSKTLQSHNKGDSTCKNKTPRLPKLSGPLDS